VGAVADLTFREVLAELRAGEYSVLARRECGQRRRERD
jgi:hypothetical protein